MPRGVTATRQAMCADIEALPQQTAMDILHYADCHANLKFGWEFAVAMQDSPLPFPSLLHGDDLYVWRAHNFLRGGEDPEVEGALSIEMPSRANTRNQIRALLICDDVDCGYVARQLHLPLGVVKAYEKLFFNVVDRKKDSAFMASIVYPEGRLAEAFENYIEKTGIGELMLRAGFTKGARHVLYAAGLGKNPYAGKLASEGADELDRMFMADGCLFASFGWMHQTRNSMPITNARLSMQASKMGNNDGSAGADLISIGDAMKVEAIRLGREAAEANNRAMALSEASRDVPKNDTSSH